MSAVSSQWVPTAIYQCWQQAISADKYVLVMTLDPQDSQDSISALRILLGLRAIYQSWQQAIGVDRRLSEILESYHSPQKAIRIFICVSELSAGY